ncbi:hypothetical protein Zmor_005849 [Zophobas morio]|uniref:Uncharacterized protein n=1 Tax=Zophobas morio TaxID=2755281 RepID=A0AA38IYI0_9CUCU|nr:hypothetical protein Zmor_005849 [Zophobas morio]
MRSAVSVLYFIILQILWIFRSLYEAIIPEKNREKINPQDANQPQRDENTLYSSSEKERRHLIHLFTTKPNQDNGRPVCYMHVCEILTPHEEEMLRCVCAKGATDTTTYFNYDNNDHMPPTGRISRATFTNAWMESFSLVI